MDPFDQSLESFDPELAAILRQARQAQELSICLLPEESFIRQAQTISHISFKEEPYKRIIDRVSSLLGFSYVELRLNAKHEAILCVSAAATDGNNEAGILYFDLMGFQREKGTSSVTDYIRKQFRNTEEFVGLDIDLDVIVKSRNSTPKLVVVDASMYQRTVDFQRFRDLADSVGAYLAVDIGYFAGLAAAQVYDPTLQVADFVIADSRGTLGGPFGVILFAREKFRSSLMLMIDQYIGEDYDIDLVMAKAAAIEYAFKEGRTVQVESVNNARELLANLRNQDLNIVFETTDTHLVMADLSQQVELSDPARTLYEIGILASPGVVRTRSSQERINVICFGTSIITNKGMGIFEIQLLSEVIGKVLSQSSNNPDDLRRMVAHLSMSFK